MLLRAGAENLTDRQRRRLAAAIGGNEAHLEVWLAWACAQRLRAVYRHPNPGRGTPDRRAGRGDLPDLPRDRVRRLGPTLRPWKTAFLAYFDTGRASNGGTEAIDGLIE